MKKLNIRIKEARVKAIQISMTESGKPNISINVGLITDDDREIASYNIGTDSWGDKKIDVPESIHPHIRELLDILEPTVMRHANGDMFALAAPVIEMAAK